MKYLVGLICALAVGIGAMVLLQTGGTHVPKGGSLTIYCAAGVRKPVEAVAAMYRKEFDTETNLQYGGSGELLSSLRAANSGDLFIAADAATIADGRRLNLLREVIPVATQRPVLAVLKGNPKKIASVEDLLRPDVRFALANDTASIGKVAIKVLAPRWDQFKTKAAVFKPTVTDIANDVVIKAVDAALVWDGTVSQFPSLEAVELADGAKFQENVSIAVLASCQQPALALRFARYLAAPQKGAGPLGQSGLKPAKGDDWNPKPTLVLFSGGVNRPAIEKTLAEFKAREGIELLTTFNGCGVLCSQMRLLQKDPASGQFPDAYYACDICFVPPVADVYPEAVIMTETDIMLAVAKDNPYHIQTLADLAKPGLKVGICNAEASTLGYMTKGMLKDTGQYDAVMKNVCSQVPTADTLVNQLRTGSLDAAIVYIVNAKAAGDQLTMLPIAHPGAKAVQPFAVAAKSPNAQLAGRLLEYLRANRQRFEDAGFRWRGDEPGFPSTTIKVPDWLKKANE